jgi:hypothetical protein
MAEFFAAEDEIVEVKTKAAPKKPKWEWTEPSAAQAGRISTLLSRRGFKSDSFVCQVQLFCADTTYSGECDGKVSEELCYAIQKATVSLGFDGIPDGLLLDFWWDGLQEALERR